MYSSFVSTSVWTTTTGTGSATTPPSGTVEGLGPGLLLAHAYVRYISDLRGGQYICRKIEKAFGLKMREEIELDSESAADAKGVKF